MIRKILGIILATALLPGCDTETQNDAENCIRVKFIRGICGNAVLQIQNPYYYDMGEDTDDETHVFLARLECFTDMDALANKFFFYVELNPPDFNTDCAVCEAAIQYSGSKRYSVRVQTLCKGMSEN